jgi:photosystem II stability/assembly factor-like uncharacterized protein
MPRSTLLALLLAATAHAQWSIQQSNTTADLRGIDNVGHGIAWASGSNGTVLHTTDNGATWLLCKTPPDAEHLDFRGIQAFDANTAIVMSSGRGDLSRLYKTTDGCQTWKLVFTNPDKEGFWDAIQFSKNDPGINSGIVVGDPVAGKFPLRTITERFMTSAGHKDTPKANSGEAAFAASNTAIFVYGQTFLLGTGGSGGARVIRPAEHSFGEIGWVSYPSSEVPIGHHTETSGIFSMELALDDAPFPLLARRGVAVGGDYLKPDDSVATAAFTTDGGKTWTAATIPPHGYRSAVAYDAPTKTWITVGPNGTDISTDDGRNWRALKPSATDTPDADQHWNALSLPFVVGPHGRIGLLNSTALQPAKP